MTLFCLPSNTTHELQPLDVAVFRSFEHHWDQEVLSFWRNWPERVLSKEMFGKIFTSVWTKCMTMANIQSGFRKCGINPFNKDVIPDYAFAPSDVTHMDATATDDGATPQPSISQDASPSQPSTSQRAPPQPSTSQRAPPQLSTSQRAPPQPSTSQWVPSQPSTSQWVPSQPSTSQRAPPQPSTSQRAPPQPSTSQWVPSQPSGSQQAPPQPSTSQLAPPLQGPLARSSSPQSFSPQPLAVSTPSISDSPHLSFNCL